MSLKFKLTIVFLLLTLAGCGAGDPSSAPASKLLASAVVTSATIAPVSVITMSGPLASYTITKTSDAPLSYTVTNKTTPTDTKTVSSATRLRFTDTMLALDIDGVAGKVFRLYQAAFNRVPDAAGLGFWISKMDGGISINDISAGFVGSKEYKDIYGSAPTNSNVVSQYYANVLGRAGDPGGVAFWVGNLDKNLATQPEVLSAISDSDEYKARVLSSIQSGIAFAEYIPPPSITTASATTFKYKTLTTITIVGQNLDQGVNLVGTQCTGITAVSGGTATQRSFTCIPNAVGTLALTIQKSSDASILLNLNLPIPAPQVTLKTTSGDIVLELDPTKAPITVTNFLQYVNKGFYSAKIFHRVISNFMIQGGGFDSTGTEGKVDAPIKLEAPNGLSNVRGTIAMARTDVRDSATSQFFINVVDNLFLDAATGVDGYAVFGKVVTGMDVVDVIKLAPKTNYGGAFTDTPNPLITIISATQTK